MAQCEDKNLFGKIYLHRITCMHAHMIELYIEKALVIKYKYIIRWS